MTERGNNPNKTFYELVGPVIDEARDPNIASLFDTILTHELDVNLLDRVSDKRKDKVEEAIDGALDARDIPGQPVVVTGKLRPFPMGAFDITEASEKRKKEIEKIFGPIFYDDDGSPYFLVQHMELFGGYSCVISGYVDDLDESGEDGMPAESSHTIVLQLNLKTSGNPRDGDLYVIPHEVEEFNPVTPSDVMVEWILQTSHPSILEQLSILEANLGDSHRTLQSLREVEIVIDYKVHPDADSGVKPLKDYIEQYLTAKAKFDRHLHALVLHGSYFGFDSNGREFKQSANQPIPITAYIDYIILKEKKDDSDQKDTQKRYEPWLQILASAPASSEHGDSYYTIHLPLNSITSLANLRNPALFTDQHKRKKKVQQQESPATTLPVVAAREVELMSSDTDGPEFTVDTDPMGLLQSREALLSGVKQRFHELLEQATMITQQTYESAEEAIVARDRLVDIISEFLDLYPQRAGILVEAEGSGVVSIPAKVDYDSVTFDTNSKVLNIPLRQVQLQSHDILAPARGYLASVVDVQAAEIDDDSEEHRVEGCLYLISDDAEKPITIQDGYHELPMHELIPKRRIAINLDIETVKITLPEYERIVRCRETITRIAMTYPDQRRLSLQLNELQDTLLDADPYSFSSLSNAALLQKIGNRVGGDEEATLIANDALADMLRDRQVKITGGMYTSNGAYVHRHTAAGSVKDVVATTPAIPSSEPMILVTDSNERDWYIPLSTLKHMEY